MRSGPSEISRLHQAEYLDEANIAQNDTVNGHQVLTFETTLLDLDASGVHVDRFSDHRSTCSCFCALYRCSLTFVRTGCNVYWDRFHQHDKIGIASGQSWHGRTN